MSQNKNKKKIEKWAKQVSSDKNQEKWENGKLGKDIKHAKVSNILDDVNKPMPTSIRLPKNLILALRELASEQGLSYQTYLKMVLVKHIKEKKVA